VSVARVLLASLESGIGDCSTASIMTDLTLDARVLPMLHDAGAATWQAQVLDISLMNACEALPDDDYPRSRKLDYIQSRHTCSMCQYAKVLKSLRGR
jgi:hypothetical protein